MGQLEEWTVDGDRRRRGWQLSDVARLEEWRKILTEPVDGDKATDPEDDRDKQDEVCQAGRGRRRDVAISAREGDVR